MSFMKEFVKWFVIINTGILLVLSVVFSWSETMPSVTLWEIFPCSAITALITTAFFRYEPKHEVGRLFHVLMMLLHYICLLGTMFSLGFLFGWIEFTGKGLFLMAISVAGVYLSSTVFGTIFSVNDAKQMNEALKRFRE